MNYENGLLGRCVVGSFNLDLKEKSTLAEIRRWSVYIWKNVFGVNIYAMGGWSFLFEFPNEHMPEHILQGEWCWKNLKINLEWWFPMAGCCFYIQHKASTGVFLYTSGQIKFSKPSAKVPMTRVPLMQKLGSCLDAHANLYKGAKDPILKAGRLYLLRPTHPFNPNKVDIQSRIQ